MTVTDTRARRAFVLRVAPSGIDRVTEALNINRLLIGWSEAEGLLETDISWDAFRSRLREAYYMRDASQRRAGGAAGNMWRFIREMELGDYVVVPHGPQFYVGLVSGPPIYLAEQKVTDTAYQRPVDWQNGKKPFPRRAAKAALQSRMKSQGTCVDATDLLVEVAEFAASAGTVVPTFEADVRQKLVSQLVAEIRTGRIENFGFERLLRSVLIGLGAIDVRIPARQVDKGADLVASFRIAGAFDVVVAVQAKHFRPEPPAGPDVVEQLGRGMQAEEADLGIAITSGTFSPAAQKRALELRETDGLRIELLDGEQLASLIIEHGLIGNLSIA